MEIDKKSFAKTTLVRTNHAGTFFSSPNTSEDRGQTTIACLGDVPLTMVLRTRNKPPLAHGNVSVYLLTTSDTY